MKLLMHYRYITESGATISAIPHGELADNLKREAMDFVMGVFQRSGFPVIERGIPRVPEILTQETIDRIDDLEEMVSALRNAMIDGKTEDSAEWMRLIDDAGIMVGES